LYYYHAAVKKSGLDFLIKDLPSVLILIIAAKFEMIRCADLTNTTDVYVDL